MNDLWKTAWHVGLAPMLSDAALASLATALRDDDPRLTQGATCVPAPLQCVQDWAVEGACLTAWCGWQGEGLKTVAEVEEYFARMCYEMDANLHEPAGCRWLLNWWDETPRDEARRLMLAEVEGEAARRASPGGTAVVRP